MSPRLRDLAGGGYPSDYLVARLHSRRAALGQAQAALRSRPAVSEATDERIWATFLADLAWLRGQMDRELRERFTTFFVLFELKTVVLCVRNGLAERSAEVERLLRHSQLHDAVRDALLLPHEAGASIGALAAAWTDAPREVTGLQHAYASEGLKGFEQELTRQFLEGLEPSRLHPVLRQFFRAFIDVRNLVTLYKHLRWGGGPAADFIAGGDVDLAQLRQVSGRRDAAALDELVRRVAGRRAPPLSIEEPALESVLLGALGGLVRSLAREGEATAVVLDYAWQCYAHARNRALVLHAGASGPDVLARELIA